MTRRTLLVVVVIQLIAIIMLVLLGLTQLHLDDEPYPCTPTVEVPHETHDV
jgi:hypothetical protein